MALNDWIGVAQDIEQVVSFFARLLAKSEINTAPYMLGPVEINEQNGQLLAQNNGGSSVTITLFAEPNEAVISYATLLGSGDTLNLTEQINANNAGQGTIAVANTPTSAELRQLGVNPALIPATVTMSKLTLVSFTAVGLMSGVKASYNSGSGVFDISFDGTQSVSGVIGIYQAIGRGVFSVFTPRSNDQTAETSDPYTISVPIPAQITDVSAFEMVSFTFLPISNVP